jgi:hypothetical protein
MLSIALSHGGLWLLEAAWRLKPSYGYGLIEVKIPAEKIGLIAAYGVRDARYKERTSWKSICSAIHIFQSPYPYRE